ncbi:MAG: hypothetical protein JWO03_1988, partial [Bacteroidetes bacterium]|nr:hypothetical protein [Bacteroidota bacterium]
MYKFIFSRIAVSLFFAVLLFVIVFKAICIPITFDESAASIYYPKFSVGEIIRYPSSWPSNHILNTLAIKASESIWGIEPWNVRLPNMISFVLFFVVMYLIAQRYFSRSPLLFCLPFAVVLGNPFLIDFFSMARGYGISNMFMVCSVFCMLRHTATYRQRWYFAAIIFSMLAAYANFTLLIFWVAANGLLVMIQIARWLRHERTLFGLLLDILFTTVLAGGFLALCYTPLYKMQSTNQFIYWSKVGFFHDTLLDQVRNFRYGVKYFGIEDIWL